MKTFTDLGIPFPLYEAPISTCGDYVGAHYCCVTGRQSKHCFRLGIGSWIVLPCKECGFDLFFPTLADRSFPITCGSCEKTVPASGCNEGDVYISYEALRSGKGGYTKDSPYGMISWQQLQSGWTHGIPGGVFPAMETRVTEEGWVQVKLPVNILQEVTLTPDFTTHQGAVWQFCGSQPLIYAGEWTKRDFEVHTPKGLTPEVYFSEVLHAELDLWESIEDITVHAFRDPILNIYSGYYEVD